MAADASANSGDHAAAFDRVAALLRAAPATEGAWSQLADAARAVQRESAAIEECYRALDADPTLSPAPLALLSLVPDTPAAGFA
jgi:DNA-binding SARP family transcriptional activator